MKFRVIVFISIFFFGASSNSDAQSYQDPQQHACLKCHSNQSYTFHNDVTGMEVKRLMNPYYILDTVAISAGVHKSFDCTDCHSAEYEAYPHQANLKLEPLSSCLDCHGGDESYAKYKFEEIQAEVEKSVHVTINILMLPLHETATTSWKLLITVTKCVFHVTMI